MEFRLKRGIRTRKKEGKTTKAKFISQGINTFSRSYERSASKSSDEIDPAEFEVPGNAACISLDDEDDAKKEEYDLCSVAMMS